MVPSCAKCHIYCMFPLVQFSVYAQLSLNNEGCISADLSPMDSSPFSNGFCWSPWSCISCIQILNHKKVKMKMRHYYVAIFNRIFDHWNLKVLNQFFYSKKLVASRRTKRRVSIMRFKWWDHPYNMYAKSSEKLIFLTPWYPLLQTVQMIKKHVVRCGTLNWKPLC